MTITPFIARAPYMAVAAASFRMSNVSMSSALMPATEEPSSVVGSPLESWSFDTFTISSSTTPSTTHSGLLSPVIDATPRIRTLGAAPNVPDTFCTDTPAALPSSMRLMSDVPATFRSDAFSLTDEPVKVCFLRF